MGIHPALTSPEIAALAGPSQTQWYCSVVNDATAATAQINQVSFTYPLAELTVDNTTASWLSQQAGMTVAIGTTPGASDRGLYRIRQPAGSTTMYIGETSEDDPGLITQSIRQGSFADDDYITIYLNRFDYWSIAPRFANGNQIYEDYDQNENGSNRYPPPIVNITINGGTRWADFVDSGQTYRTAVLVATPIFWPGTSLSSYHWFLPSSWTVTAGSITTNTVTVQIPAQQTNYTFELDVTELHGKVTASFRNVWAHDTSTNAPLEISSLESIDGDRQSCRGSFGLKGTSLLSNIPDGAMINVWCKAAWNGVDVPTAFTQFVGWITQRTEHTETGKAEVTLEFEGVGLIMQRIGAYSQFFTVVDIPTDWQEIIASLSYVDFMIWWCIVHRASGILQLFNYTPLGISNTQGRLPLEKIPNASSLMEQCKYLAQGYMANIGSNPDGELLVCFNPNLLTDRSSVVNRGTLDASIYTTTDTERTLIPSVRKVRGEGFFWDGVSLNPTPYLCDAPGDAPGQGVREERLQSQFVDSQTDLNQRTVRYWFNLNNPKQSIPISIKTFYAVFYPAEMQFFTRVVPGNIHPSGQDQNERCIVKSFSLKWSGGAGSTTIDYDCEGETDSVTAAASTVAVPLPIPSTPPVPVTPSTPATSGNIAIAFDSNGVFKMTSDGGQTWTTKSYSGLTDIGIFDYSLDPYSPYLVSGSGALNIYLVTSSGLFYGTDILNSGSYILTLVPSASASAGFIRTDIAVSGGGIVNFDILSGPGPHKIHDMYRFTSHGSSNTWTRHLGSDLPIFGNTVVFFDINQNGTDEVLFDVWTDTPSDSVRVYRILNGGVPVKIFEGFGPTQLHPGTLQRPLKTPSGVLNSSTGSSEYFIYSNNALYKSTNGGGVVTGITPGSPFVNVADWQNHFFFTPSDNGNLLLVIVNESAGDTFLGYSADAGSTYRASSASGMGANGASRSEILKTATGYRIYMTMNSSGGQPNGVLATISTEDLTTWQNWGASWGSTGGGWQFFIPLS